MPLSNSKRSDRTYLKATLSVGVSLLMIVAAVWYMWSHRHGPAAEPDHGAPQALVDVHSAASIRDRYDVIVAGTDPDGVTAAVSAARNGLKTLLVDDRDRTLLGGLMTEGWLNSIDMNYDANKQVLNKGLFSEWYGMVEGDSFDVNTAANAFYKLASSEKNIDLLMRVQSMKPILEEGTDGNRRITGLTIQLANGTTRNVQADAVIDATQDADIAAAAGVPYTVGREDLGDSTSRMAVTLVFRINHVTPQVWKQIQQRLNGDNDSSTGANARSAYGYKEMYDYKSTNPQRVQMRGLNIGRQNDDTALINALQIFGVDDLDPASRKEGMELGQVEIPHVVDYMRSHFPEFAGVAFDGTAPELYVRESRHIEGEYRLNILDVLENRDQWDRIAFGSYPADIQRLSPSDWGSVVCDPIQYAIPFRSIVPLKVDNLLVVGRSASFDTLPSGSARVIPVGMATGQAAGAAAKVAEEKGITFRELSRSREDVALLQQMLNDQGMVLHPFSIAPQPFMEHKDYPGLKAAISIGFAAGGYKNDFHLDDPANAKRAVNMMLNAARVYSRYFPGDPNQAVADLKDAADKPLTLAQAAYTLTQGLGWPTPLAGAASALMDKGYLQSSTMASIIDKQHLTNGDMYMLLNDLLVGLTGRSF